MRKNFISLLMALLLGPLLLIGGDAAAKVYVDLDSPNFQLFPIAICDFTVSDAGVAARSQDSGVLLADEIKKYLTLTGYFNLLNKKSFLEDNSADYSSGNIVFANWTMIGADYLLKGNLWRSGKDIMAECRLFDVIRGELVFGKKYQARDNEQTILARRIASDILYGLTGDEGDFNTQIAFVAKKGRKADIYAVNYDGSDLKALTHHHSLIVSPRWSPDGRFLAFTSFRDGYPEIYIRDLQNGSEKKVASYEGLNLCGYWSPDGRKILLTLSKDGNEELYVLEINSLKLERLTNNYSIDVSPAWSPDGKKIAFVSNRDGSPQIYSMDADGNNVKRITFEGNYNTTPSWSPRGGRIAYEGRISGKYQIFTIDEEGNNLLQLTFDAADNESPSWSPSGRQIAYSSKTNSKSKICVMNANGLNGRVLKEDSGSVMMPMWSPRFK